jgi:mannosylglycerate hydrolase
MVRQVMDLPEDLSADGRSRSGKTVPVSIETRVRAYNHSRRIDFSITIDNGARSHRLRALFPFGDRVDGSLAETHFGVIERKNTVAPGGKDWPEKPLPIFSMQRFAGIRNSRRSLFIINRGLQEYEIYQREDSVVAITLHRGVGVMGKADLAIRPGRPSGIEIPTPDAESPGMLAREYALIVGGKIPLYEVAAEADRFTSPSLAVQNRINIENIERAHEEFFRHLSVDTVASILTEQLRDVSCSGGSYITLTGSRLSVSAVKKAEDGDSIIIRVFNAGEESVRDETMRLDFPHHKVFVADLLEEEQTEIPGDRDYVLPVVNPNCQLTLKIARQAQER